MLEGLADFFSGCSGYFEKASQGLRTCSAHYKIGRLMKRDPSTFSLEDKRDFYSYKSRIRNSVTRRLDFSSPRFERKSRQVFSASEESFRYGSEIFEESHRRIAQFSE